MLAASCRRNGRYQHVRVPAAGILQSKLAGTAGGTTYAEKMTSSPGQAHDDATAAPRVFNHRGQDIMQITSSTIGNLYATTQSLSATVPPGNRLNQTSAQSGADRVTLSNEARALADADQSARDAAGAQGASDDKETATKAETAHEAALKALNDYVKKGPVVARVEAIREEVLKSMGLSEADLKNLPPEQQQQIEATIAERIKEQLMQKKADKSSTTIQQSELAQPLLNPSGAVKSNSM